MILTNMKNEQLFKFYDKNNKDITRSFIYGQNSKTPFYIDDKSKYCDSSCRFITKMKYDFDISQKLDIDKTFPYFLFFFFFKL